MVVVVLVALATLLVAAWPASGAPERARAAQAAQIDFNGDGFDDLAVGAPGEAVGGSAGAGAVNVLYGSADGLVPGADLFFQGSGGVGGTAERDDGFGAAVAQGTSTTTTSSTWPSGRPARRSAASAPPARSTSSTAPPAASPAARCSSRTTRRRTTASAASLAAGDFDGDSFFDLAVGAPGENVGAVGDAGAVTVLFGSAAGITTGGAQTLFQGGGAAGTAEAFDRFGQSVASGVLADDDVTDLVVGVPGEDVGQIAGGRGRQRPRPARPAAWSTAPWPPRATPRAATRSGPPWPPATSTRRPATTWPSAPPGRR